MRWSCRIVLAGLVGWGPLGTAQAQGPEPPAPSGSQGAQASEVQGPEPQAAQGPAQPPAQLPVRATSSGSGTLVGIDRGTSDGVRVHDVVYFQPRVGRPLRGKVSKVFERWALVQMGSESVLPEPGTRGQVRVPARRLQRMGLLPEEAPAVAPEIVPQETGEGPAEGLDEPGVASEEDADAEPEWDPSLPLLTAIQVQDPAQRDPRVSGRIYMTGKYFGTDQAGRSDAVLRTGLSWRMENPWRRGGVLEFDAEIDYRRAEIPTNGDRNDLYLRVDRLSYRRGGTRFDPTSVEFGRFLQKGMPEFGVLDGFEWTTRRVGGDQYGVSIGAMPEPDAEQNTGSDLQVAGFYRWVDDVDEVLSFSLGAQKSFHNGNSDRDLVVSSLHFQPPTGWDFHATAWIDYYGGSEVGQGPGIELTQLIASTSRRYENGAGMDVVFSHYGFPDIDRNEFLPPDPDEIARLRVDRLAWDGWHPMGRGRTVHGRVSVWDDQDESGGDAEAGLRVDDILFGGAQGDLTLFGTDGDFSWVSGARATLERSVESGRWDLFYEFTHHKGSLFDSNVEAIAQHRLQASREFRIGSDWYLSLRGGGVIWDDVTSWSVGFYLQRSF